MEIKITTKFEDNEKLFMVLNNTFIPVEVISLKTIVPYTTSYNVDKFDIKYDVRPLCQKHNYTVLEEDLYTLEDMENVLKTWGKI